MASEKAEDASVPPTIRARLAECGDVLLRLEGMVAEVQGVLHQIRVELKEREDTG